MKGISILLVFIGVWLAACQDVTVGFLKTENATYGLSDSLIVKKELNEQEDGERIKNNAPWVTKPIQGVNGTAPISYAIESVSGPNKEAETLFMSELEVIGSGIMLYPLEHKAPAGRYLVTLRVSNEGYSKVVKDVFTFIVK